MKKLARILGALIAAPIAAVVVGCYVFIILVKDAFKP